MGLLNNEMRDIAKKEKLGDTIELEPKYKTGLDVLDYRLGNFNSYLHENQVGVKGGGTIIGLVGASGGGKTALALKIGSEIVRNFDEGMLVYFNFEHGTDRSRIQTISGFSDEEYEDKVTIMDKGIYTENFYKYVNSLAELKLKNAKSLMYDTGYKNENGDPIRLMQPSVLIIDSIPTMQPAADLDEEELNKGMAAAKTARINNDLFKKLSGSSRLVDANINIIYINHITTKISINAFSAAPKELTNLNDGESLPGGSSIRYLTDTLLRVTQGGKLKADKDFYIAGRVVHLNVMKSRSASSEQVFDMIFSPDYGFLNDLTNYNTLADAKIIKAAGPYSKFANDEEYVEFTGEKQPSFTKRTFREVYANPANAKFREYFDYKVKQLYEALIPRPGYDPKKDNDVVKELDETVTSNFKSEGTSKED